MGFELNEWSSYVSGRTHDIRRPEFIRWVVVTQAHFMEGGSDIEEVDPEPVWMTFRVTAVQRQLYQEMGGRSLTAGMAPIFVSPMHELFIKGIQSEHDSAILEVNRPKMI